MNLEPAKVSSQFGEDKERSHKPTYIDTEKMRVFLLLMVVSTVFGCLRNSQSFFETEYNDFLSTQKCFGGNCQVNTKVTNCDGQECEGHVFSQTVGEDVFGPGSDFAKIFGRR